MIEGRNFKERLLNAVQDSYQSYVDHGLRCVGFALFVGSQGGVY